VGVCVRACVWWGAGVVICLELGADLRMAQLMLLPLTVSCFSKIQFGFAFLYWLTPVVLEKGPLNGCMSKGREIFSVTCQFGSSI